MGDCKHRTTIASTDLGKGRKVVSWLSDQICGRWVEQSTVVRPPRWHLTYGFESLPIWDFLALLIAKMTKESRMLEAEKRQGSFFSKSAAANPSSQTCQASPRFHLISDTHRHPRSVLLAVSPASTFMPDALNAMHASAALHGGLC